MWIDFHCHCLPNMDDGAENADVSLKIIESLKSQDVDKVVATPHLYLWKEELETFLNRRKQAVSEFKAVTDFNVLLGAEVALESGLSETDLTSLCIENTNLLLLELPYVPYKSWMLNEIENIAYKYKLTPIFAHIDRYVDWYEKKDFDEILSFEDAIFQINLSSFLNKKAIKLIKRIMNLGYPIVLGSDAHNLTNRCPEFDRVNNIYYSKKNFKDEIDHILNSQSKIF